MGKIVTFGEIMLRLKSPGYERLFQGSMLEANFGGGEANAAVSLANYGKDAAFVSVVPDGAIGDACIRELRGFGVDTTKIVRRNGRMGIYYFEAGIDQRSSKVIYDRAGSTMAVSKPGDIDWDKALDGAEWFHISGITPAISQSAADLSLEAVKAAKAKGIQVSCDLNYRKNLWKYGREPVEIMGELCRYVDTIIGCVDEVEIALGMDISFAMVDGEITQQGYRAISEKVLQKYPSAKRVCIILPETESANQIDLSACLCSRDNFIMSHKHRVHDIVDRVGIGDAFCGGMIYGLTTYPEERQALEFAIAASCLKNTVPGDFNRVTVPEVESLMAGAGSGNVQR